MAFVYEVNGQKVEFDKEPTEADIDEAARSLRPAPKSAQPKPIEGQGGAAFGVYRPAGRRPESQNQNREENKDMALQTARGAASNVFMPAGLPVDIANAVYNLPRTAQDIANRYKSVQSQLAGNEQQPLPELPAKETIPGIGEYGMNFYNQFVPGPEPTNAAGQLAFAGGQALGAPIANKVVSGAIAAPRVARNVANQVKTGSMEGLNPTYRPGPNTAFAEVGDTFYPNKTVEPFMKMTPEQQVQALPALEASQQPSSSLFSGFLNKAAQRLAPEGPQGGTLVPLEGRGVQAFTEQNVRDFFNKPSMTNLSGATGNLGGAVLGGLVGGFPGALAGAFAPQYIKALELLAQKRLQGTAGLKPGFQQQLGQAQQTAGRLGLESAMPQTPPLLGYNPNVGGAVPPTMYVNPQGQATTNLAGTQVNMNPGSMAVPTPAANAAMATTQAKAAGSVAPQAPRAPAQPKVEWTLPDVATHYNQAAQGSTNFGDTFNRAVAARTADILKDAKQRGIKMSPDTANYNAYDDVKKWRSENVEAFKPKQEPVAAVEPIPTGDEVPFQQPKVDPEVLSDQRIWKMLQDKTQAGTELVPNELTAVKRITKKYGNDPFQTGDLKGNKVFEAPEAADIADGYQVRAAMKMDAKGAITSKNNKVVIDEALFNDTAKSMGMPEIDWTKVKGIEGLNDMSVAEARKAVRDEINRQFKDANAYAKTTRGPTQATRIKQEEAAMDPAELARLEAAGLERVAKMRNFDPRNITSLGNKTPMPNKPVEGPVIPEGVAETPKPTTNELLEMIKARSKKGKTPPDVMEMKTGGKVFDSKADYEAQVLLDRLAGKPTTGSFVDNGLRYEITEIDYGNTPKDLLKRLNKPLTEVRVFSEKSNKQVSGPAVELPEKSLKQRVEEKMRKRK